MVAPIDHQRFISLLTERFPEVAVQIDDCARGLLHPEMATLARATQRAIDACDVETVRRHFQFVEEVFQEASPEVENAVYVSYLENLRFEGRKAGRTKARAFLPARLQQALTDLEAYLAKLFGGSGRA